MMVTEGLFDRDELEEVDEVPPWTKDLTWPEEPGTTGTML